MTMKLNGYRILLLLLCLACLVGCATPQIKTNEKIALTKYKELFLLPPKEDPRRIVPKVVTGLENIGFKVKVLDPEKPIGGSQGTGFVVSNDGHIITCAHVLSDEKAATIWLDGIRYEADVIGNDNDKDLCLLKIRPNQNFKAQPLIFSGSNDHKMGQDVFTIGYPMSDILGNAPRLSKGLISSARGLKDDPDFFQISAEIQPGNSGGPLFEKEGSVIGIVQKTLNPIHVLQRTGGALPQNVNFALKSRSVIEYLSTYKEEVLPKTTSAAAMPFDEAQHSVVQIHAGIVPVGSENIPKIFARLAYVSFWDLWYRFRVFHIEFYDYETGDPILKAGQYGDNAFSTEQKVIDATFEQIKKQLGLH